MMIYRLLCIKPTLHTEYWDDLGTQYVTPPEEATVIDAPSIDIAMGDLRDYRNARLYECDYTQLDDAPLTPMQKEQWRDYRQAWRDYPGLVDVASWSGPAYPEPPKP
jgi:hypothetical protein